MPPIILSALGLTFVAIVLLGCYALPVSVEPSSTQESTEAGSSAPADSIAAERSRYVQEVLASIAGREGEPAREVFENLEHFGDMPAGRLVRVMDMGFGKSLGVSCTHCHTPDDWAAEDSTAKHVARQMIVMARRINQELLPTVEGIRSASPTVNCTTCHRGSPKPMLNMP